MIWTILTQKEKSTMQILSDYTDLLPRKDNLRNADNFIYLHLFDPYLPWLCVVKFEKMVHGLKHLLIRLDNASGYTWSSSFNVRFQSALPKCWANTWLTQTKHGRAESTCTDFITVYSFLRCIVWQKLLGNIYECIWDWSGINLGITQTLYSKDDASIATTFCLQKCFSDFKFPSAI